MQAYPNILYIGEFLSNSLNSISVQGDCLLYTDAIVVKNQEGKRMNYGLALSGGGTKGAVHVGVLKALEEKKMMPDAVAGTSSGSIAVWQPECRCLLWRKRCVT